MNFVGLVAVFAATLFLLIMAVKYRDWRFIILFFPIPMYVLFTYGHFIFEPRAWEYFSSQYVRHIEPLVVPFGITISMTLLFILLRERGQAERELRNRTLELTESRNRMRAIFDNAPVELYLKDVEGRYVEINRRFEELFNVKNEGVIGKFPEEVHDKELGAVVRSHDLRILESGEVSVEDQKAMTEMGERILRTVKFPVYDDNQVVTGLGAVITDVTEIELARREAIQANAAKSDFLATMSHELRTPLNAILGFSKMIEEQYFGVLSSDKYIEYAHDIHRSSEHLLSLINDVLDLSAIEAGKHRLIKEDLIVDDITADSTSIFVSAASKKDIELSIEASDKLPTLLADSRAVKQILTNLLSNAIKFTPEGGNIILEVTATNGFHAFKVSDTGVGVPAEKIPSLTEPFVSAEPDPFKPQEGTGLGLAIVKSLVDLHGGELEIESEVGVGTTITVKLPSKLV
jgi:PAS domain S-box-containing protein